MSRFFLPTKIFFGKDIVLNNKEVFTIGKRAFIITSPSSFKNGSIEDVILALKENNIEYSIYSTIAQNPTVDQINEVSQLVRNFNPDYIIGIGGGSPLDSAKAVAVLAAENSLKAEDLFDTKITKCLPIIAIPTTCGTGSEVTPYSILTSNTIQNKKSFASELIFPKYALVDYKYLFTLPYDVTINTSFDALSHLIEGYLSKNSDELTEIYVTKGLELYSQIKENLKTKNLNEDDFKNLALISLYGGIVIAQTGTLIVHPLGYNLTYFHNIPHGKANAIFLASFLKIESKYLPKEVEFIINKLGFVNIDNLSQFINELLKDSKVLLNETQIKNYAERSILSKNVNNLRHTLSLDEMIFILNKSVNQK